MDSGLVGLLMKGAFAGKTLRDAGFIPGWRRSPGVGNGNTLPVSLPGKFHGRRKLAGHSA